jgi:hypothetical protein
MVIEEEEGGKRERTVGGRRDTTKRSRGGEEGRVRMVSEKEVGTTLNATGSE